MSNNLKLHIYKGMIQYLLDSTDYSLKRIAVLSNSTIKKIRLIHHYNEMPIDFHEERQLVQLYQIVIGLEKNKWTGGWSRLSQHHKHLI